MGIPVSQADIIEFLKTPAAYGLPPATPVEVAETHGAVVFLAGPHAYKLKRAVKYAYLDYSTVERRHQACRAELDVNRRAAPGLYLDVKGIVRAANGFCLVDEAAATDAADWVLVMRRFEQDALLEQMRAAGRLTPELMRALAETIAEFHETAERRPGFGGAAAMSEIVEGNLKVIESMAGSASERGAFEMRRVDALARLSWAVIEQTGGLLDKRRDDGRVRRCHGDLHLNNICLVDGRPTLFDAIEFNESFASIDVLYDLAFLLMDLDRHGLRGFANLVLNCYLERTGDYGGLGTLPLFLSCRAAIRAHVTVTRAAAVHADTRLGEARDLLDRAIAYLEPPPAHLIALGGVSGTGKSTVARALAPQVGAAPGAVILRSDVTRKRLMGVDETTRLPPSAYTDEVTNRVFATMAETASGILAAGHSVILDAVYGDPRLRAEAQDAARRAGVRFEGIWLEVPSEVLEQRIAARHGDASDATVAVLHEQLAHIQPPADWTAIAAGRPVDKIVAEIRGRFA